MRPVLTALAVLCSLVLVMTACGEEGDQQVASESTKTTGATKATKKLPGPGEPLSPGTEYVTTEFQPELSFRVVDEGWEFVGPEFPDLVDITRSETYLTISFVNPRKVYDPKRPSEEVVMPEPKDWVAWHQNHPYLKTGKVVPVTIGGVSGVQFEEELSSAPRNYPKYCADPCVPTWPLSDGSAYGAFLGDSTQTTILKVAGETVIIDVSTSQDEAEELRPKAQEVLGTVEWKDAD